MSIQDIIDSALKPKEKHEASGLISPSSLGQCYRRQFWARSGEEPSNPIDERTLRVFKCGNIFEKLVVDAVLSVNPDWQTQVELTLDDVHGYADLVSPECVFDVKSQHSRKFWYNDKELKEGKDLRDMFYNHWLQVMMYALILNRPKSSLIYVSKDDLCINEFTLPLDDYWKDALDVELTETRYYWKEKTLPPAQPRLYWKEKEKKFAECDYCSYKDKCNTKKEKK